MTSKERARLRAMANTIEPVFQIGKGGLSDALITQTKDALKARELIKLKVLLETSPEAPKELAVKIAEATESEVITVVGGSIVLFKENPELREGQEKGNKTPVRKPVLKTGGAAARPRKKTQSGYKAKPKAARAAKKAAEEPIQKDAKKQVFKSVKYATAKPGKTQNKPAAAKPAGKPAVKGENYKKKPSPKIPGRM